MSMSEQSIQQQRPERSPGRPRSSEVHEAILRSAIELLSTSGYEHMSIEAVAAHAGVGKTAIYRRWSTKEELIVDALSTVKMHPEVPEAGDVQQDLIVWIEAFIKSLDNPIERQGLALLIGTLLPHPQLAERYWSKYAVLVSQSLVAVLQHGQKRGEIRPDIDLDTVVDIISGTVFYQVFMKPPAERKIDRFKQAMEMLLR